MTVGEEHNANGETEYGSNSSPQPHRASSAKETAFFLKKKTQTAFFSTAKETAASEPQMGILLGL